MHAATCPAGCYGSQEVACLDADNLPDLHSHATVDVEVAIVGRWEGKLVVGAQTREVAHTLAEVAALPMAPTAVYPNHMAPSQVVVASLASSYDAIEWP
jgi:hypothetical protein